MRDLHLLVHSLVCLIHGQHLQNSAKGSSGNSFEWEGKPRQEYRKQRPSLEPGASKALTMLLLSFNSATHTPGEGGFRPALIGMRGSLLQPGPQPVMQIGDRARGRGQRVVEKDYFRDPNDNEPIDERQVMSLITERDEARLDGNFQLADDIRWELFDMGVLVQDKDKVWYVATDEELQAEEEWLASREKQRIAREKRAPLNEPIARANDCSAQLSEKEIQKIEAILEKRDKMRGERRFEEADELRLDLEARGVTINDDRRLWRADKRPPKKWKDVDSYVRSDRDPYIVPDDILEKIESLLSRRLVAKKGRHFEKADALEDELRSLGVETNDEQGIWYVSPLLLD